MFNLSSSKVANANEILPTSNFWMSAKSADTASSHKRMIVSFKFSSVLEGGSCMCMQKFTSSFFRSCCISSTSSHIRAAHKSSFVLVFFLWGHIIIISRE